MFPLSIDRTNPENPFNPRSIHQPALFSPLITTVLSSPAANKIIIITAPSGSGKTTLVRRLLAANPCLAFSISACTRSPRAGEVDGRDYHFLTEPEFKRRIDADEFVEWEMVYTGKYYGTLREELQRIWDSGRVPLVDIDVKGALAIKDQFPDTSLSIFIKAPSLDVLRERLVSRGTESPQMLEERLAKAEFELLDAPEFHRILINDDLETASAELLTMTTEFIAAPAAFA